MKNIKVEVTVPELSLLTTLLSDQLFRREFIDTKMPGYKPNPAELAMGKELVSRLRAISRQVSGTPEAGTPRRASNHASSNHNGVPDAV